MQRRHEVLQMVLADHRVEEPAFPRLAVILVPVDQANDVRIAFMLELADNFIRRTGPAGHIRRRLMMAERRFAEGRSLSIDRRLAAQ